VFLGPDEHLQVIECLIAEWSVIRVDHLSSQHESPYILLTAREKGTFDSISNSK
jgi:hypothetical protein